MKKPRVVVSRHQWGRIFAVAGVRGVHVPRGAQAEGRAAPPAPVSVIQSFEFIWRLTTWPRGAFPRPAGRPNAFFQPVMLSLRTYSITWLWCCEEVAYKSGNSTWGKKSRVNGPIRSVRSSRGRSPLKWPRGCIIEMFAWMCVDFFFWVMMYWWGFISNDFGWSGA